MSINRPYWIKRIESAWAVTPIAWLAGVRRSGKTTLTQYFKDASYINCDLPSSRALLEDPESFFKNLSSPIVVFDEIHQLHNPSEILKIGADLYGKKLKILATGSSTLAATNKFKDTLTGRKRFVHLVPLLPEELSNFGIKDIKERMLKGGLPPAILSPSLDADFYGEWIDSFYARDVQELYKIEKRQAFIELMELLLRQNSNLVEVTQLSKVVGVGRPTIIKYLEALETTQAISIIRPFHGGGKQELVSQPKIYGFDTGFVAYAKGWTDLRPDDCGHLLENLVLESLQAIAGIRNIHFWRTKQQHEIDFILSVGREQVHTIECKWKGDQFEFKSLKKFREEYPHGKNYVVCVDAHLLKNKKKSHQNLDVNYISIEDCRIVFTDLVNL
jgi:predicted AAA+ superfamily ATPase